MLAAFSIGDNPGQGVASLGVMVLVAALFFLGSRSSRRWPGSAADTRRALEAGRRPRHGASGLVLILVSFGAFMVKVAQANNGSPYFALCADRRRRLRRRDRLPALALLAGEAVAAHDLRDQRALAFGVR